MSSKRVTTEEQFRLIMECRKSGLSDYQWCQMHGIRPGTFYNWISRLRKRGMAIPMSSDQVKETSAPLQEVVKVNLIPDSAPVPVPMQVQHNTRIATDLATRELPTVEILIGNATIRFFNNTDKSLIEATLGYIGGVMVC
ncbi:MAG: IS66 family insertion sequence element accessory protein TnpB [Herbinix sp.]|nr:IS66 family insertion sequence element accessory protein TnpB [Herbinix sp.]